MQVTVFQYVALCQPLSSNTLHFVNLNISLYCGPKEWQNGRICLLHLLESSFLQRVPENKCVHFAGIVVASITSLHSSSSNKQSYE